MKKISDLIDKEKLLDEIIKKFGKQKKLAERLGISEDNFSSKFKRLSNGFIKELEYQGIKVPYLVKEKSTEYKVEVITKEDLDMVKRLKELGIDSVEQLNKLLDAESIAEDIKEVLLKKFKKR